MFLAESSILGIDGGILKSIALVACFAIFVSIALWLAFSRSTEFHRAAHLPLEEDNSAEAAEVTGRRNLQQSGSARHD